MKSTHPVLRWPDHCHLCRVKPLVILLALVLVPFQLRAQTDSIVVVPIDTTGASPAVTNGLIIEAGEQLVPSAAADTLVADTLDWRQRHSSKRATLYSAVLPGAGQIYNRKYWKAPIVWAGVGVSFWFIQRNTKEYRRYKDAYLAVVDNDPTTIDEFNGEVSSSQLLDVTDTYRRWRDLSYIAIGMVYMLNIVDASVDAHFVRFDVGRDLTMGVQPAFGLMAQGAPGLSVCVSLR